MKNAKGIQEKITATEARLRELKSAKQAMEIQEFLEGAKQLEGKCFKVCGNKNQYNFYRILKVGSDVQHWGTLCGGGKLDYSGDDVQRIEMEIHQLTFSESSLKKYVQFIVGESFAKQNVARKDLSGHYRLEREIPLEEFQRVADMVVKINSGLKDLIKKV